MKALNIAFYNILMNFREKRTLLQMLLFPVVLIFILGTALSGSFNIDNLDKTTVYYLNEDKGIISQQFEGFLENEQIKQMIKVVTITNYDEGADAVKEGNAVALIHLEKDLTEKALKGEKVEISVRYSQYSSLRASIVKTIVDSFSQGANAKNAFDKLGVTFTGYTIFDNLEEMPITTKGSTPGAIDYYAVTMLTMTIMYGTIYGVYALANDKLRSTYIRLHIAPVSSFETVVGQILGVIATIFLQAVILVLFTKYVYKVNWGSNIPMILFICLSAAIMSVSIGIMVYKLVRDHTAASALFNILVSIFTFIGGGYIPLDTLSESIEKISFISPNYLIQQTLFNTIYNGSAGAANSFLTIIWIASAIMLVISAIAGRRGEA